MCYLLNGEVNTPDTDFADTKIERRLTNEISLILRFSYSSHRAEYKWQKLCEYVLLITSFIRRTDCLILIE